MDDHLELSSDLETQEMERSIDPLADTPVIVEEIEQEEADLGEVVDVVARPAIPCVGLSRVGRGGGSAGRGASSSQGRTAVGGGARADPKRGRPTCTTGLGLSFEACAAGLGRGQTAGAVGLGQSFPSSVATVGRGQMASAAGLG
jgi:hypothetical protein